MEKIEMRHLGRMKAFVFIEELLLFDNKINLLHLSLMSPCSDTRRREGQFKELKSNERCTAINRLLH
jgi:hypothetical protein